MLVSVLKFNQTLITLTKGQESLFFCTSFVYISLSRNIEKTKTGDTLNILFSNAVLKILQSFFLELLAFQHIFLNRKILRYKEAIGS